MDFEKETMTVFWRELKKHGWQQIGGTHRFQKKGYNQVEGPKFADGKLDKNATFKRLCSISSNKEEHDMTLHSDTSNQTPAPSAKVAKTKAPAKTKMTKVKSEATGSERKWIRFGLTEEEVARVEKVRKVQGFMYNATLAKQVFIAYVDDCLNNPVTPAEK